VLDRHGLVPPKGEARLWPRAKNATSGKTAEAAVDWGVAAQRTDPAGFAPWGTRCPRPVSPARGGSWRGVRETPGVECSVIRGLGDKAFPCWKYGDCHGRFELGRRRKYLPGTAARSQTRVCGSELSWPRSSWCFHVESRWWHYATAGMQRSSPNEPLLPELRRINWASRFKPEVANGLLYSMIYRGRVSVSERKST
jgi:hypothetical protein